MTEAFPRSPRFPPLHPLLFASYASLSLVASNLGETPGSSLRLILLSILLSVLAYIGLRLITREWVTSGMVASVAVVLFFSYGHVLNLLQFLVPTQELGGAVLTLWLLLFIAASYGLVKLGPRAARLSGGLTVAAAALNLFPLYSILTYSGRQASLQEVMSRYGESAALASLQLPQDPPDVYYIVLDAYGRSDVLEQVYQYDNSAFLSELRSRGFAVDAQAVANYTHSEISMGSSLNMRHFDDLPEYLRAEGLNPDEGMIRAAAAELIQLSSVRKAFESLGYASVSFDSGYVRTRMDQAQEFVQSPEIENVSTWQIGLEFLLLDTTMGGPLVQLFGEERSPHARLFDAHRERVLFTLDHLADFASAEGNYFIFAHVISPHVPFVFDADGNPVRNTDPYTLLDARGGDPANIPLYADQLHYLNSVVLRTIDAILAASDSPPIIVLQSDHGSKVYSESDPPLELRMRLFLPILSAIHSPGAEVYPGMTPVNTFRVLFNERFGGEFERLPDTSYWLDQVEGRWEFLDVCQVYAACADLRIADYD